MDIVKPDDSKSPEGGSPTLFTTTQWSVILRAQEGSSEALGELAEQYQKPLLVLAKARGLSASDAEQEVQDFIGKKIRGPRFLTSVKQEKAKFRTFVRNAFSNHLIDRHRRNAAHKRSGGQPVISLDELRENDGASFEPQGNEPSPYLLFDRAWAYAVVERACLKVLSEAAKSGHEKIGRKLLPHIRDEIDPGPESSFFRATAEELGTTEGALRAAATRIRMRLRRAIRQEVLQTVSNPEDFDGELAYLRKLYPRAEK